VCGANTFKSTCRAGIGQSRAKLAGRSGAPQRTVAEEHACHARAILASRDLRKILPALAPVISNAG
jgi:hypothetical protein